MTKIRRNAPCPCGSGLKYKECYGSRAINQQQEMIYSPEFEQAFQQAMKKNEAKELIRKQQQGLGKPIISVKVDDHRIVAVGNALFFSKKWRYFADFLADYIKHTLGSDWSNSELAKPFEDMHPIIQWYQKYCEFSKSCEKLSDGTYTAEPTGVVYCYLGLAYNLFLLKHNVELQRRLIERLKDRKQFQGAYYELIVANCLVRAGFELVLEDESDSSTKHCEFSAVSKLTGEKYWVEAKMRSVAGLLGKTKVDGSPITSKPTANLSKHLGEALKKPAADKRLIFLDVNAPLPTNPPSKEELKWVTAAERQLEDREKELKGDVEAYVFVTSISFHRALEDVSPALAALVHGLGISDFAKPGPIRLSDLWRQKQKHIDAHKVIDSLKTYPKIPNTFDGDVELDEVDQKNRIEIGETYFFEGLGENGIVGKVTSVTVLAPKKQMYIAISTEDRQNQIISKPASNNEIQCYEKYGDAFFGSPKQRGTQSKNLYEHFEWLVDCYLETPKEKLLEMCSDAHDFEALKKLEHQDLVLEICERWAMASADSFDTKIRL